MTTKVAVVGASGTMGRLVSRLVTDAEGFELVASLTSRSPLSDMLAADLVVDVTLPAVSQGVVEFAVANGRNVLVGTSGWSSERISRLEHLIKDLPGDKPGVVIIPNFSIGSVLATSFAAMAARFYDSIEIIGRARAALGPVIAPHADQRARGQQVASVPIHSLRMQGVVAKQDVVFGGTGETLTLSHTTMSETSYEAGILLALEAARTATGVVVGLDRLIDLGPAGTGPTSGPSA